MKIVKITLLLVVCFCSYHISNGQTRIKIGDTVSNMQLGKLVNHALDSAKVATFSGKLLILDFWATWCSPCIRYLPKIDSLQEQFDKEVQVLGVTMDSEEKVVPFLSNLQKNKNITFPTIVNDKLLTGLFYHQTIPHYVWINKSGIVQAITSEKEVTAMNIRQILKDPNFSLIEKRDGSDRFDLNHESLFSIANPVYRDQLAQLIPVKNEDLGYYSIIKKGRIGNGAVGLIHDDSTRITYLNTSIRNLYRFAFGKESMNLLYNQLPIIETNDRILLTPPQDKMESSGYLDWLQDHAFSYELKIPAQSSAMRAKMMQEDLNRYFKIEYQIEGVLERRLSECLILKVIGDTSSLRSKGGKPEAVINPFQFRLSNLSMNVFLNQLHIRLQNWKIPIVDEVNFQGTADLAFKADFADLDALNKELIRYGIELVKGRRMVNVIIIRSIAN